MNDSAPTKRTRRAATKTGCAVEATISVIGGIWKPVILFHLLDGFLQLLQSIIHALREGRLIENTEHRRTQDQYAEP